MAGGPALQELTPDQARARVAHGCAHRSRVPRSAWTRFASSSSRGRPESIAARLYIPDATRTMPPWWSTSTAAVSSSAIWTPTTTRAGSWPDRSGPGSCPSTTGWPLARRSPRPGRRAGGLSRPPPTQAGELGAHPARIGVAGDSAGGNLAAGRGPAVPQDGGARHPPSSSSSTPGWTWPISAPSYRLFGEGFYLTEADLDWYAAQYVTQPDELQDPRCSPLPGRRSAADCPRPMSPPPGSIRCATRARNMPTVCGAAGVPGGPTPPRRSDPRVRQHGLGRPCGPGGGAGGGRSAATGAGAALRRRLREVSGSDRKGLREGPDPSRPSRRGQGSGGAVP